MASPYGAADDDRPRPTDHALERAVGVEWYASGAPGTGGRLRARDEDFRVREVERFATRPVDAPAGEYPYLVVRTTLRGWDTNDFVRSLSNAMGIGRERVAWAGTKDANAVTTQLFSIRDATPDDLPRLARADVEVVGRAGRALEFGDLAGNSFEIGVRDADAPENAVAVTDDLAAFGGDDSPTDDEAGGPIAVPNFFGQQRFGSYRPVTHEVGLAVVQGDWEGAVMAYLGGPTEHEPSETRKARAFAEETRDWEAALDRFPAHLGFERTLLGELVGGDDAPDDFRSALQTLPWNLQRLFVNAAQSYAFNRILSARLERGLPFDRPVAGDVVCFAEEVGGLVVPDPDRIQQVTERRVGTVTRHCERGRAFVTAPLVGTETELADGDPGDVEREILADCGLDADRFDLPGAFGSTGTRRAVLVRTDVTVECDPLRFAFDLPKGSYATVVLREYLKASPLDL